MNPAIVVVAALLLEPTPVATSDIEEPPDTYVVVAGDSLTTIAVEHDMPGPSDWRRLFDANPEIEIPDLIHPGQELVIPDEDDEFEARPLPAPPPPPPAPEPRQQASVQRRQVTPASPAPAQASSGGGAWDRLAQCESGGNPRAVNPSGRYRGAFQFDRQTWASVGGSGDPAAASYGEQLARAKQLQAQRGWSPWPQCSRKLGLR